MTVLVPVRRAVRQSEDMASPDRKVEARPVGRLAEHAHTPCVRRNKIGQ